jgi:hypothetical protein
MSKSTKVWFPAKSYGWGWGTPTAWQGWVVLGMFVVLLVAASIFFPPGSAPWAFGASVFVLCVTVFGICYVKGETPRWSWGSK